MLKRLAALILLPLALAGCTTTFTNLTPQQQGRNPNNVYPVEVAFQSTQQTMKWDSIHPQILVGTEAYPMRPTPLMTNRWEGLIPVPSTRDSVTYRYKFDYQYNTFGKPQSDTVVSPEYTLRVKPQ